MTVKKLRRQFKHQCLRKIRHENVLTALQHIRSLERIEPEERFGFYGCEFCGGVHVGHNKKRWRVLHEDTELEPFVLVQT